MSEAIVRDVENIIEDNPALAETFKDKSFLVTGATGAIGRYVVSFLAQAIEQKSGKGTVLANVRDRAKAERIFGDYLNFDHLDLLVSDVNDLRGVDEDIDYIIHAASPTQPDSFLKTPVDIIATNVFATHSLLELAKAKRATFCLLSTLEIYGRVEADTYPVSVTEDRLGALDSTNLRSAYPESKRLAENLCVAFKAQYGVDSVIVRLAPIISPEIDPDDKRVFAQFVHDALDDKEIIVYSDAASKKRSYTDICDAVTGIFTALCSSTQQPDYPVFNLANNNNVVSIQELAQKILSIKGASPDKLKIISRDDSSNTSASTGAILLNSQRLQDAGWSPRYSIEDTVRRSIKHLTS